MPVPVLGRPCGHVALLCEVVEPADGRTGIAEELGNAALPAPVVLTLSTIVPGVVGVVNRTVAGAL